MKKIGLRFMQGAIIIAPFAVASLVFNTLGAEGFWQKLVAVALLTVPTGIATCFASIAAIALEDL